MQAPAPSIVDAPSRGSPPLAAAFGLFVEAVAVGAGVLALMVLVLGEVRVEVSGHVIRARDVSRPLALALVFLACRFVSLWTRTDSHARGPVIVGTLFRMTALAALGTDLGLVLATRVASCGGLDSSGYVGGARLLLQGRLTEFVPVAGVLPFVDPTAAAAPLGFVAAREALHIAPEFPLGTSLVMAAFEMVLGESGPFYVAPVLGVAAVALMALLLRRVTTGLGVALAAVMIASSPTLLNMAIQPMSDVPATFWMVLAAVLLWRPRASPWLAGCAAGMAILTRPPLLLPVLVLAWTARWSRRRDLMAFGAITGAWLAGLLLAQGHMYGDALVSGHGSAAQLFTLASLPQNLLSQARWLVTVHTPLIVPAFVAGLAYDRRFALRSAALYAATTAPYLFHSGRFTDWEILRFVLPGLVFVLAVCACGVIWTGSRVRRVGPELMAALVVVALAGGSWTFLKRHHVFSLWDREFTYTLVGEWFARRASPNAVAVAGVHSGSIHYLSRRPVVRLDVTPPDALLDTVDALQHAGYDPYLVVEQPLELELFQRRYRASIDSLDLLPKASIRQVYVLRLRPKPPR